MKKILLAILLLGILFIGFYVFLIKKTNAPIQTSTENQIVQALSQKNNWDASQIELNITTIAGDFAKGDVKFKNEMGGGLWFAARVNSIWKIVYDGNGIITCDQLANYQNFPTDLIPSCYDKQTDTLVTRERIH